MQEMGQLTLPLPPPIFTGNKMTTPNALNPLASPFSFGNNAMNYYLQAELNNREAERKTSMSFNNWNQGYYMIPPTP
jgi:hypothetical protein